MSSTLKRSAQLKDLIQHCIWCRVQVIESLKHCTQYILSAAVCAAAKYFLQTACSSCSVSFFLPPGVREGNQGNVSADMLPPANIDSVKGYVADKPVSLSQVACEACRIRQCWVQLSCLCMCVVSWCVCCGPGVRYPAGGSRGGVCVWTR